MVSRVPTEAFPGLMPEDGSWSTRSECLNFSITCLSGDPWDRHRNTVILSRPMFLVAVTAPPARQAVTISCFVHSENLSAFLRLSACQVSRLSGADKDLMLEMQQRVT